MKSVLALVVSLTVLSLAAPLTHAQAPTPFNGSTPNINPNPKDCCKCITISFNGMEAGGANGSTGPFIRDEDNNYYVDVAVTNSCFADCTVTKVEVFGPNGDVVQELPPSGGRVIISPDIFELQRVFGYSYTVKVTVDGDTDEDGTGTGCEKTFELSPCEGGCNVCPDEAPTTENNGSFTVNITVPSSIDGAKGILKYHAKDFSYAGRTAIHASLPPSFGTPQMSGPSFASAAQGQWNVAVSDLTGVDGLQIITKLGGNVVRTTTVSFIEEGSVLRHRMDTEFENSITRHEQTNQSPGVYVLAKGKVVSGMFEPLWEETLTKTKPSPNIEVQRRVVRERASSGSPWSITSDIETTWEKFLYEWEKTKEIIDPSGEALTSTWSYYQPGEITGPGGSVKGLGKLKKHTSHDGYEIFHTYGLNQRTTATPYGLNPAGQVESISWDPGTKTYTSATTILGQLVSKTVTVYTATSRTDMVHTSASEKLTTVTQFVPSGEDFGGKSVRVIRPDGTITTYSYTRETGGGFTTVTEQGSTTNGTTVAKGTRTTTTTNSSGTTILSKTEAIGYGTGSAIFGSMAVTSVDNLGRALVTAHHPAAASVTGEVASATSPAWTATTEYTCCGISKETDMYGIPTFYAYDGLQRQTKTNRLGVSTETVRKGLTTETHRYPESVNASLSPTLNGTSSTLVAKSVSNLAGTLSESWSPDPTSSTAGALVKETTTTTYKPAVGLSTRTVTTTPDNFSQTTDSFLDGRTAATYGALSPAKAYSYSVNVTGESTSQSYVDGTNLCETTTSQTDWAGRELSTTFMDSAASTMTYNSVGQLVKTMDSDGVTILYGYNTEGERVITAIDLNVNGQIDYGTDTVSFSETEPALSGSNPIFLTTSKVWQPGDSNANGGTIISTSARRPNDLTGSSQSIGVANQSTSLTVLGGSGNWTITNTAPDATKQVQTYTAGLLASIASLKTDNSVLHTTSYGYDSLNRLITEVDSGTGAATTVYRSATSDAVASVTDPGNRVTAYTYDVRGGKTTVNAPDSLDADGNALANVTTTNYNPDGTVAETTGDQTYRTTQTYDYAQRQITLTTYGTTTATTYWTYSPTRGFLTRKGYHDGKGADYAYTAAGRLSIRGWARGVCTSYAYDNGGRLVSTTYSDNTPDVTVTYDALGRQVAQTNGVATTTYAYNASTLALDTETIAYDIDGNLGADFTRVLDRNQDNLRRDIGWQLKDGSTMESEVTYAYGANDGRLASVGNGTSSFSYGYAANTNLIATVTGPVHTVANTWESTRDILAAKENKVGTTTLSSYTYNVNHLGQRAGVSKAGTAFAAARTIDWGYNSKGELVKADNSITGFDRAYEYDGIGNRLKSADSLALPTSNNYTPNALNQYTSIGSLNPGYDDDGNAIAYPLPAYPGANSPLAWDAENRLISATVNSVTTTYLYDSQSRRIATKTGSITSICAYDGWNPIAEYSGVMLSKTYTWGMDLSGSMQGAGGVGGLLSVTDGTGSYFPTYDGNGNVGEYLDTTGAIAAHYEYDPFGNTAIANGAKATDFAHRFSTKPLDNTTGLYYYGYRFYDPTIGRWPSRDPIEEEGGVNLSSFCDNAPINRIDYLGQSVSEFPNVKVKTWNKPGGLTTWSWRANGSYSKKWFKMVWVVKAKGKIKVTAHVNKDRQDFITEDGKTMKEHEEHHVAMVKEQWDTFRSIANGYESDYCHEPCASTAANLINLYSLLHAARLAKNSAQFDLDVYGPRLKITNPDLYKRDLAQRDANRKLENETQKKINSELDNWKKEKCPR